MTQENDPWEGGDPHAPLKEKPSKEELAQIVEPHNDQMLEKPGSVPGWMWILQGISIIYIVVNIGFLYANITNQMAGIVAAYMLPLTMLLFFLIYTVGELKKIARGKKR